MKNSGGALKNEYEIRGNHAVLFLRRKTGTKLETTVDIDALEVIAKSGVRFNPLWNAKCQTFYAAGYAPIPSRQYIYLHRLLTNAPVDLVVDHEDHNGLNNQQSNLRIVTHSENQLNRRGPAAQSTSGVRGVYARYGKWAAGIKICGKWKSLGVFATKEEAGAAFKTALDTRIFPKRRPGTVYWDKRRSKWCAQVKSGYKKISLGRFTERAAAETALLHFLQERSDAIA